MAVITDKLRAVMSLDPSAPVIDFEETWFSWGQLKSVVDMIEVFLEEVGCPSGGRVGVLLRNRPGHVAAFLAVLATDRCLVTLNPLYPDDTLKSDIEDLDVPVVIGEAADLERPGIRDAIAKCRPAVIAIDALLDNATLLGRGEDISDKSPASGVAVEMLTSGTTGKPKRVPLTQKAFDASFADFAKYERGRSLADQVELRTSTTLIVNPLTHIGGIYGAIGALMAGRRICLLERFSVAAWTNAVIRHRPRVAPGVPAALRMLLEADLPKDIFSSLSAIISGTAPLDPAIVDAFLERYGVPVLGNYGATEFAGGVAGWSLEDFRTHWKDKRGAAGRLHAGVQARIVDEETGAPVEFGEEGLLELKAAQIGKPDEWRRTTDRAVLDADGFLFIRGRADNAIVRGGFKVHPDDVVRALEAHDSIREAAVVGIPDERLGETPAAAIILAEGKAWPGDDAIRAFLKKRLLPYQVPARFKIVDDFPRTGSMKPQLTRLRDMLTPEHSAN